MTTPTSDDSPSTHPAVSIKATYYLRGKEDTTILVSRVSTTTKTFDTTTNTSSEARAGLPQGQHPTKPELGDYSYSGMHDQGPLLEMKEGGSMAVLLGCALQAKDYNNAFLTEQIEQEKKQKQAERSAGPAQKKSKTNR